MTDTPEIEVWISAPPGAAGLTSGRPTGSTEVKTHSKHLDKALDAIRADSKEFVGSWQKTIDAVKAMFATAGAGQAGSFELDSMTVKLSLTATGKVVFVGELGGEIAFEAVFKRHAP
jgi:hypothetical protein